jgi:phosphatidylglycerophosphate synthase
MSGPWRRLADWLTVARLAMLTPLWALAVLARPVELGIGVAIAGSTDVLDGMAARRSGEPSRYGSQIDSLADVLLMGSTVTWLVMLRREFFRAHAISLCLWLGIASAALLVGWLRFRRVGDLHLYSTKALAPAGYLFSIYTLIFGPPPDPVWFLVISTCIYASTEVLAVQVFRHPGEERLGSFLALTPVGRRHRALVR